MKRKSIVVAPATAFQARPRLFSLLSELYPVDFTAWQPGAAAAFDGAILWEDEAGAKELMAISDLECLVVTRSQKTAALGQKPTVQFSTPPGLDPAFRGQTMTEEGIVKIPALALHEGDEVLCRLASLPYWATRRNGTATLSLVALGPEEIADGETVYTHFNRCRWLQLLPFFHFLKQLTRDHAWEPPPVRACLMFDDPNLHWPTYGFLDLRQVARHARVLNYHVAFAMVPLDAWLINPRVKALFRAQAAQLSLCMHGNNHAPLELAAPLAPDQFTQMLAQGLRRIERFEKQTGVPVARVMVPPYGAFQEKVAEPMRRLGYEAACVSRASLTSWNPEKAWPATFGHGISEFIGGGLPVIPRQVMAPGHAGSYRLAAFLNQPIIPHGHHQDCARGLELLDAAALSINNLGAVTWTDMTAISHSNYLTRRENDTLIVKMLARHIALPMPAEIKQLVVERPWLADGESQELLICHAGGQARWTKQFGRHSDVLSCQGHQRMELISTAADAVDFHTVEPPQMQAWLKARRWLSEVRDRLAPLRSCLRSQTVSPASK